MITLSPFWSLIEIFDLRFLINHNHVTLCRWTHVCRWEPKKKISEVLQNLGFISVWSQYVMWGRTWMAKAKELEITRFFESLWPWIIQVQTIQMKWYKWYMVHINDKFSQNITAIWPKSSLSNLFFNLWNLLSEFL